MAGLETQAEEARVLLVVPGRDESTEDHGEDGQLDGRGESLPVSSRGGVSL